MLQYVWRDILKGIEKQFIIYSKQKNHIHKRHTEKGRKIEKKMEMNGKKGKKLEEISLQFIISGRLSTIPRFGEL